MVSLRPCSFVLFEFMFIYFLLDLILIVLLYYSFILFYISINILTYFPIWFFLNFLISVWLRTSNFTSFFVSNSFISLICFLYLIHPSLFISIYLTTYACFLLSCVLCWFVPQPSQEMLFFFFFSLYISDSSMFLPQRNLLFNRLKKNDFWKTTHLRYYSTTLE